MTGRTSGGKLDRVEGRLNIKELISRSCCRICRERGHWARECPNKGKQVPRDGEEANTSFFVHFGGDHSTPLGRDWWTLVAHASWLDNKLWKNGNGCLQPSGVLGIQKIKLEKAMTFSFGNDETLKNQDCGHTPFGIGGGNGVLRVYLVPGGTPLLLSKE